jgi:hypothetical protein
MKGPYEEVLPAESSPIPEDRHCVQAVVPIPRTERLLGTPFFLLYDLRTGHSSSCFRSLVLFGH